MVSEADNDLWDSEEEGLNPEFHELSLEGYDVSFRLWLEGSL